MFEFNGKKINANDLSAHFTKGVKQHVKQEFGEQFRSICHPKSREFPTVIKRVRADLKRVDFDLFFP